MRDLSINHFVISTFKSIIKCWPTSEFFGVISKKPPFKNTLYMMNYSRQIYIRPLDLIQVTKVPFLTS